MRSFPCASLSFHPSIILSGPSRKHLLHESGDFRACYGNKEHQSLSGLQWQRFTYCSCSTSIMNWPGSLSTSSFRDLGWVNSHHLKNNWLLYQREKRISHKPLNPNACIPHLSVVTFFLKFYFIFKLYIIVLVLPNIKMNPPQVYMCSPSWTLLPPPSRYHPSGSSQCTSPKHPVSCIEPGLATRFIHDILHVSCNF